MRLLRPSSPSLSHPGWQLQRGVAWQGSLIPHPSPGPPFLILFLQYLYLKLYYSTFSLLCLPHQLLFPTQIPSVNTTTPIGGRMGTAVGKELSNKQVLPPTITQPANQASTPQFFLSFLLLSVHLSPPTAAYGPWSMCPLLIETTRCPLASLHKPLLWGYITYLDIQPLTKKNQRKKQASVLGGNIDESDEWEHISSAEAPSEGGTFT